MKNTNNYQIGAVLEPTSNGALVKVATSKEIKDVYAKISPTMVGEPLQPRDRVSMLVSGLNYVVCTNFGPNHKR